MSSYTLPRDAFETLEDALGDRKKGETFARAMESVIEAIDERAKEAIAEKKEHIKIELKEDLTKELVTRELFDERLNVLDERFKSLNFKLNIFIAIALISLTFSVHRNLLFWVSWRREFLGDCGALKAATNTKMGKRQDEHEQKIE
ncbi:MAG: hypothetical protein HZA01_03780 [Nitrospinae bacterium]|nr:hypothetical protein [Nitrospinota bacterium]